MIKDGDSLGTTYTWESIDQVTANFTPDITPLVLAGNFRNPQFLISLVRSKNVITRGTHLALPRVHTLLFSALSLYFNAQLVIELPLNTW